MELQRLSTRALLLGIAASLVVLGVHLIFLFSPWSPRLDNLLLDFWFNLRGPEKPRDDIVIVSMDEASYQNLGLSFNQAWPRELHANLLEKLAKAGAKRVVFDILFLDPGPDQEQDSKLAKALALIPSVINADQGEQESAYGSGQEIVLPFKPFAQSAAEVALASLPEEFGYVRHFYLPEITQRVEDYRPLAFAAVDYQAQPDLFPGPRDYLNLYGVAGYLPSYSYYQILEEAVPFPLDRLRDKIIFVGLQLRSELGPDQKDSFLTSFSDYGRHYGVELHATAAANLLSQNWIRRLSLKSEALILSIILALVCHICFNLRPLRAACWLLLVGACWLTASFLAFRSYLFFPGLSVIGLFGPLIFLGSTLTFYFVTRQSQRQLRRAFELYLSPHMANQVSNNPKALGLGGQKVFATALFTDIADFTTLSESLPADQLTHMLNDYFSEVVDSIFESEGTLIKFIGDAVFALWGAPVKVENHAEAALCAAMRLQERTRSSTTLKKYPALHTRIGINSGPMVVGNLGSRKRFDFTAIGDSVNLASRVEGLNKYLGTSILLTEAVKEQLKSSFRLVHMGRVCVVGKAERVGVYTIADETVTDEHISNWQKAVVEFQLRSWGKAEKLFINCQDSAPFLKKAAKFYLEQLGEYKQLPPPDDWDGELVLKAK